VRAPVLTMQRCEFLARPAVNRFVHWMRGCLDRPRSFIHEYWSKKPRHHFRCDSLYAAFEQYRWPYSFVDPATGRRRLGETFTDTHRLMTELADRLRGALAIGDADAAAHACVAVLAWGGVHQTKKKVESWPRPDLLSYLAHARQVLDVDSFDTSDCPSQRGHPRRARKARLRLPTCPEDIDYRHPRGLDRGVMRSLVTCGWLDAHRNVIITGPTGLGKTFIACVLGERRLPAVPPSPLLPGLAAPGRPDGGQRRRHLPSSSLRAGSGRRAQGLQLGGDRPWERDSRKRPLRPARLEPL